MENSHIKTTDEVLNYFNVDEEVGLSDEQVKRQVERFGYNGIDYY